MGIKCFLDIRCVDPFWRYSRSKSKVLTNRADFWRLCPPNYFLGQPFQTYPHYHACLAARRLVKFREVTPTNPKVISTQKLNFEPNFRWPPLKFWRIPSQFVVCASKPLSVSSACKNLRARQYPITSEIYSLPKKVHLGGSKLTCHTL